MQVDEVPEIGDQLTVGDQAEIEAIFVAMYRDVEADAVRDRRDRDVGIELRSSEVQRLARPWHVRDHNVDRRIHAIREFESGHQPDRRGRDDRRCVIGRVAKRVGGHQVELALGRVHRVSAQRNAFDRVGAARGQVGDDRGHAVGPRILFLTCSDRHGHHCSQRPLGQLVFLDQVLAERSGADRHDDIVQGAAGGVLQTFEV